MVHYKFYYFDIRGLGETGRLILHYANVPFEDIRVSPDDWPTMKPSKFFWLYHYLRGDSQNIFHAEVNNSFTKQIAENTQRQNPNHSIFSNSLR